MKNNRYWIIALMVFATGDLQSFWFEEPVRSSYDPYAGENYLKNYNPMNSFYITAGFSLPIFVMLYAFNQTSSPSQDCIEKKYPFAYAWYKSLIEKYSDLNFQDQLFIENNSEILPTQARSNIIEYSQASLKFLNVLYEKKITEIPLSYYESLFLAQQELIFLQKVGFIKNYGSLKNFISVFGVLAFVKTLDVQYHGAFDRSYVEELRSRKYYTVPNWLLKSSHNSVVEYYLENRDANLFIGEMILFAILGLSCLMYQDIQAFNFAIKHIDTVVLEKLKNEKFDFSVEAVLEGRFGIDKIEKDFLKELYENEKKMVIIKSKIIAELEFRKVN